MGRGSHSLQTECLFSIPIPGSMIQRVHLGGCLLLLPGKERRLSVALHHLHSVVALAVITIRILTVSVGNKTTNRDHCSLSQIVHTFFVCNKQ